MKKYFPHLHKNSFNALSGYYGKEAPPLDGIMRMLAQIGYVLSDILEVLTEDNDADV